MWGTNATMFPPPLMAASHEPLTTCVVQLWALSTPQVFLSVGLEWIDFFLLQSTTASNMSILTFFSNGTWEFFVENQPLVMIVFLYKGVINFCCTKFCNFLRVVRTTLHMWPRAMRISCGDIWRSRNHDQEKSTWLFKVLSTRLRVK